MDGIRDLAVAKGRTMVFGVIVFFELFFALSCRSFTHNINELGLFGNKMLLYSLIGESAANSFYHELSTDARVI